MTWVDDLVRQVHAEHWAGRTVEHPGWERNAGRIYKTSGYTTGVQAIGVHHTAQPRSTSDASAVGYMFRAGIGNVYLAKDGTAVLTAAGPSYTQGRKTGDSPLRGNADHWSIEIANDGVGEPYTEAQQDYLLAVVPPMLLAFAEIFDWPDPTKDLPWWRVPAHFEWAPGRKIDPRGESRWSTAASPMWDMDALRTDITSRLIPKEPQMATLDTPLVILDTTDKKLPVSAWQTVSVALPAELGDVRAVTVHVENISRDTGASAGHLRVAGTEKGLDASPGLAHTEADGVNDSQIQVTTPDGVVMVRPVLLAGESTHVKMTVTAVEAR